MDDEGDMIVLVVVDEDRKEPLTVQPAIKIESENFTIDSTQVDALIETAEKHGEYIPLKVEPPDDDDNFEYEYLEDQVLQTEIKSEEINKDFDIKQEPMDSDGNESDPKNDSQKHRSTMLKPSQWKSYVAQLRKEYPELRKDEDLLINTLEQVMRNTKPPPPPDGFTTYVINESVYQCVKCKAKKISLPAISRHYQERHGPRYLVCYACGVDFRCATSLYKHEKRCIAKDKDIVLRARGQYLGRKGRSRPYLTLNKFIPVLRPPGREIRETFPCGQCSAVFSSRQVLQSHENLHRGERPYRCDVCSAAYTSSSTLKRHARKHSNEVLICDHCNRSFKIKAALVAHMDTHLPVRKFKCETCGHRYAQKAALVLHERRVHLGLPPPCACKICPKRYPRNSLLNAHMKREHGLSIITRKMLFTLLPNMTELEVQKSKIILQSNEGCI